MMVAPSGALRTAAAMLPPARTMRSGGVAVGEGDGEGVSLGGGRVGVSLGPGRGVLLGPGRVGVALSAGWVGVLVCLACVGVSMWTACVLGGPCSVLPPPHACSPMLIRQDTRSDHGRLRFNCGDVVIRLRFETDRVHRKIAHSFPRMSSGFSWRAADHGRRFRLLVAGLPPAPAAQSVPAVAQRPTRRREP